MLKTRELQVMYAYLPSDGRRIPPHHQHGLSD